MAVNTDTLNLIPEICQRPSLDGIPGISYQDGLQRFSDLEVSLGKPMDHGTFRSMFYRETTDDGQHGPRVSPDKLAQILEACAAGGPSASPHIKGLPQRRGTLSRLGTTVENFFGIGSDAQVRQWKQRSTFARAENKHKDILGDLESDEEQEEPPVVTKKKSAASGLDLDVAAVVVDVDSPDPDMRLRKPLTNEVVAEEADSDDEEANDHTVARPVDKVQESQSIQFYGQVSVDPNLVKAPKNYALTDWFGIESSDGRDFAEWYSNQAQMRSTLMKRTLKYPVPVRKGMPAQRTRQGAKLRKLDTRMQFKLDTLPSFWPIFNIVSLAIMLVMMCVELGLQQGVAPIGTGVSYKQKQIFAFGPVGWTNVTTGTTQNMWIGPETDVLLHLGAKYTPCITSTEKVARAETAQQKMYNSFDWGCCKLRNGACSMTPQSECAWEGDFVESWVANSTCAAERCQIVNRPCCVSVYGQCVQVSESYCNGLGGYWHSDKELCSEVDTCMEDVCGMGGFKNPEKPNQWWRFFTAIFLHVGIFHFVLNALFQLSVGIMIERSCGWLRFGMIFMIAGVGGNIVSALFSPYSPQVGSSGALYGLLAVQLIELFQCWPILANPWREVIKLSIVIFISLFIGTLPWIDNWAHIGGFIFGIPAAIIFLPYITFGKWDKRRKIILIACAIPTLIFMFVGLLLLLYVGSDMAELCPWCSYINCIPYTKDFCTKNAATWDGSYVPLDAFRYAVPNNATTSAFG